MDNIILAFLLFLPTQCKRLEKATICFSKNTGKTVSTGNPKDVYEMSMLLYKNITERKEFTAKDAKLTLQVRDRGQMKEYANCTLVIKHPKTAEDEAYQFHIVKCRIPKKMYVATQIHQLTVTWRHKTTINGQNSFVRESIKEKIISNNTWKTKAINITTHVEDIEYQISHVEQTCIPIDLRATNNLTVVLGHKTPSESSYTYDAVIQWKQCPLVGKSNTSNNSSSDIKKGITSYKYTQSQSNDTTTIIYIDGKYNGRVRCACPRNNQCPKHKNRKTNGDLGNCSLYMIGFMQCTTYRICVHVGDNNNMIDCRNLGVPCTSKSRQAKHKKDEAVVALLITLFVCVALILFFTMIVKCDLF